MGDNNVQSTSLTRPSFEETHFAIARDVAQRSTCPRLHTGAVIVRDNRVVATGYNGSLPGTPHCDIVKCWHCTDGAFIEINNYGDVIRKPCIYCKGKMQVSNCLIIDGHCKRTVHAEANAITQAARYGPTIEGCTMYALHEPCIDCTQLIISSGIVKVYIAEHYRSEETTKYIEQLGCDRNLFVWSN